MLTSIKRVHLTEADKINPVSERVKLRNELDGSFGVGLRTTSAGGDGARIRSFLKTLHELQRLQAARRSGTVIEPLQTLEVNLDVHEEAG